MKRRDILKLAPAALVAAAAPAAALCVVDPAETPISSLFRKWKVAWREVEASETDEDSDAAWLVLSKIEARLFAEPAKDERDICFKLLALTLNGADWTNDRFDHGGLLARETAQLLAA